MSGTSAATLSRCFRVGELGHDARYCSVCLTLKCRRLEAENARLREEMWRPIATAPKDRTRVYVFRPLEYGYEYLQFGIDWWQDGGWWRSRKHMQPTHWQPCTPPREAACGLDELLKAKEGHECPTKR